jgi:hypothetical protein
MHASAEGILKADVRSNDPGRKRNEVANICRWTKVRGMKIRNQSQDVSMAQVGTGAGATLGFGDVGRIMC